MRRCLFALLVLVGCAPPSARPCVIDDDCAIDESCVDEVCAPTPPRPPAPDAGRPPAIDAGPPPLDAGPDAGAPDAGPPPVASSCAELLAQGVVTSGAYEIEVEGALVGVECEMELNGGGWTRVAALDFAVDFCPDPWAPEPEIAGCRRDGDGISQATFLVPLSEYSEVLGRIVGRQFGTTDGFAGVPDLGEAYVDGASVTATDVSGRRVHVWTLAAGHNSTPGIEDQNRCPCDVGSTQVAPDFVGTDFFCDTASVDFPDFVWLDEPLWDEEAFEGTCGEDGAPSYFHRALPAPVASVLDVRLMANQPRANEDVGVTLLELYVR